MSVDASIYIPLPHRLKLPEPHNHLGSPEIHQHANSSTLVVCFAAIKNGKTTTMTAAPKSPVVKHGRSWTHSRSEANFIFADQLRQW